MLTVHRIDTYSCVADILTKAMPKLTSSYDEFKKVLHNIVGGQPHLGKPRPIQWAIVYILEVLDTSSHFA